jgi:hypothetical protein
MATDPSAAPRPVDDTMVMFAAEPARAAPRERQAQGLDLPPAAAGSRTTAGSCAAPPSGTVSTAGWPFTLRSAFPTGALHRTLYADVRLADLPGEVRELLRALGCGPWLDDPDETATVEAEIVGTEERGGVVGPISADDQGRSVLCARLRPR